MCFNLVSETFEFDSLVHFHACFVVEMVFLILLMVILLCILTRGIHFVLESMTMTFVTFTFETCYD